MFSENLKSIEIDEKETTLGNLSNLNHKYLSLKRFLDIVTFLILLLPVIVIVLIASIFIFFESKGSIIYTQQRVGKNGACFNVFKLRTMYENADRLTPITDKNDSRITKTGKVLRRLKIDELPQIFNVALGQMSFIGPRPLTPYEYEVSLDSFKSRLLVPPGITGLAQVSGGSDLSNEDKLDFDLEYIRSLSINQDAIILLKTIVVVISGHGFR